MKLFPFPFKSTESTITAAAASWPWPRCATATPKTLSFRAASIHNTNPEEEDDEIPNNPESAVMSGLRSERLFFDPGATSSMLQAESKSDDGGESQSQSQSESAAVVVVVMDSSNPFLDFRVSMAEMMEACGCGARDWGFLEELLERYLRVNAASSHGYIIGAFADLLISAAAIDEETTSSLSLSSSSAATKYSFTSSSSSTHQHILLHKNV